MIYLGWQVFTVSMLLIALAPLPYDYYTLLRFVVCPVSAYGAYLSKQMNRQGWCWSLGVFAALFNPIMKVHLQRETWMFLNIAAALITLAAIFAISRRRLPERKS